MEIAAESSAAEEVLPTFTKSSAGSCCGGNSKGSTRGADSDGNAGNAALYPSETLSFLDAFSTDASTVQETAAVQEIPASLRACPVKSDSPDLSQLHLEDIRKHMNELSDKISRLSLQVEGLEDALDIETRERLAATIAFEESRASIQELTLASPRLGKEGPCSRAAGPEMMSTDRHSRPLAKKSQDRGHVLEACMQKAVLGMQVGFESLFNDAPSKETCAAEWQQLEGQMKELQEVLERECHERKQAKTVAMELRAELEKAYKRIMDEMASLSKALKKELEALVNNVLADLDDQSKQIGDMQTQMDVQWKAQSNMDMQKRALACPSPSSHPSFEATRSSKSKRHRRQQTEDQETRLDDLLRRSNLRNAKALCKCSLDSEASSECSQSPRSAAQNPAATTSHVAPGDTGWFPIF